MHNYLHGVRSVPDEVVYRALQHLEEGEFNEIVKGVDRIRSVGIIREDDSIDYSLILQAIALAAPRRVPQASITQIHCGELQEGPEKDARSETDTRGVQVRAGARGVPT